MVKLSNYSTTLGKHLSFIYDILFSYQCQGIILSEKSFRPLTEDRKESIIGFTPERDLVSFIMCSFIDTGFLFSPGGDKEFLVIPRDCRFFFANKKDAESLAGMEEVDAIVDSAVKNLPKTMQ
jgi:hypothetical protein